MHSFGSTLEQDKWEADQTMSSCCLGRGFSRGITRWIAVFSLLHSIGHHWKENRQSLEGIIPQLTANLISMLSRASLAFTFQNCQTLIAHSRKTVRGAMGCDAFKLKNNCCLTKWCDFVGKKRYYIVTRNKRVRKL